MNIKAINKILKILDIRENIPNDFDFFFWHIHRYFENKFAFNYFLMMRYIY